MKDKTVIVTGANTGIGFETAAELARFGAKVIMACRDQSKATTARQTIIERLRGKDGQDDVEQRLILEELDLTDLDSVRAFATRMLQLLPRLDVLINNAGVAYIPERKLTKDGFEMTMATNHFGHFLLTNLLLPLLKQSVPSRIVVVSSLAHKGGKLNFDDLAYDRSYNRVKAYCDSKLANLLFTRELARRLDGSGVVVTALHPGVVDTDVPRHMPAVFAVPMKYVIRHFLKTPLQGAQTSIYLASSQSHEALQSGLYFADCRVASVSSDARNDEAAKRLWEISERLTKFSSANATATA